jgi:hypothetical protein
MEDNASPENEEPTEELEDLTPEKDVTGGVRMPSANEPLPDAQKKEIDQL